jgi:hypothetical protein
MLHHVKDLSPEQKHAVEILLGHPVSEDETLSIRSLHPTTITPSRLSPDERIEAFRSLTRRLAGSETDAAEEEFAVNEALRSTRTGYRPIG